MKLVTHEDMRAVQCMESLVEGLNNISETFGFLSVTD